MDETIQDLMIVRDILTREIETINVYQRMLDQAQSAEVTGFLSHIIEEEKEHVAEAIELIQRFDPKQAALLREGRAWEHPSDEERPPETAGTLQTQVEPVRPRQSFTVGPLRQ